jgi:hypothetical protein
MSALQNGSVWVKLNILDNSPLKIIKILHILFVHNVVLYLITSYLKYCYENNLSQKKHKKKC